MTLWKKIIDLKALDEACKIYNDYFPIEVRYMCADMIESKILNDEYIDINNPQFDVYAANFVHALIQHLEHLLTQEKPFENNVLLHGRLEHALRSFTRPSHNPREIYLQIRDAIKQEQMLVQALQTNPQIIYKDNDEKMRIRDSLFSLRQKVIENNEKYKNFNHSVQDWSISMNLCSRLHQELSKCSDATREEKQKDFDKKCLQCGALQRDLMNKKQVLSADIRTTLDTLRDVQSIITNNHLRKWQREQALSGNGALLQMDVLDEIQNWFDTLCELLCNTRQIIDAIRNNNNAIQQNIGTRFEQMNMYNELFEQYYKDATLLLHSLIVSGFVVEKQPPQVMKTHARFAATVRLLITAISIQYSNPTVQVTILSENQAQAQQNSSAHPLRDSSGEILNNTGSLEMQQTSRQLSCSFRNMQLKKIRRAEKKGTESVMDEKFALLFQANLHVGDLQIHVWVMSLPVVVIVHGNQEPQSWATITWDNAFSEVIRIPFHVVDKVPWSQMVGALNMKFQSQTGRGLTQENMNYLCEKAFRNSAAIFQNADENLLSWSLFCKETLPDRNFTFWDWFYAIMKLTLNQLRGPWADGHIMGFISKQQAEDLLMNCAPGTFLLRFSDSELGGVTIAFVQEKEPKVLMLSPFLFKDFTIRSIGDRIKDLNELKTLYPAIPKDQAFYSYYTNQLNAPKPPGGYVRPDLVTTIKYECKMDYPSTPLPQWQSPEHSRASPSIPSFSNSSQMEPDDFGNFASMDGSDVMQEIDYNTIFNR